MKNPSDADASRLLAGMGWVAVVIVLSTKCGLGCAWYRMRK
jgi:hypothetical protein